MGEKVTCTARQYLRQMVRFFMKKGYDPLVMDTDGVNFSCPVDVEEREYVGLGNNELVEKGKHVKILGWVRMEEKKWNNYDDFILECVKHNLDWRDDANNDVLLSKIKSTEVEPDEVGDLDYYGLDDDDNMPGVEEFFDDAICRLERVICNIKLI